jgi:Lipoprotein confined to pathogenic Mycobacterium
MVVVMVAIAGCASGGESSEGSMSGNETQFSQLMQRPDIDQVAAGYEAMYAKVRQELSVVVPMLVDWRSNDDPATSMCGGDYSDLGADGQTRSLPNWLTVAPIPDADWARAVRAVDVVVRGYGFDSGPITAADKPGNHYVAFYDKYSAALTISSGHSTDILLVTGCHLTAAAKDRGHPTPTPTY